MNLLARFLPEIFRTKKIFGSLPCIVAAVLAALMAVGLFANGAHAATWYLQPSNNVTLTASTTQWNSALNGTGSNPAALPSAGNTDTWIVPPKGIRVRATAAGNVWLGGITEFQATSATNFNQMFAFNAGWTMQDVVLNGGGLTLGTSSPTADYTATAGTVSVDATNGGVLGAEGIDGNDFTFDFDALTGSGDLRILGISNGAIAVRETNILISAATDLSGYTGTFRVLDDMDFGFLGNVSSATFGLFVETPDSPGTIEAKYLLQNNVSVTSATFGTTALSPGTYTGTDLANLGLGDFVVNNGGTIVVVPEPSTIALAVTGGLLGLAVSRRRR